MALIADDAADRADQLLLLTERLTDLIAEETRRIEARQAPGEWPESDEKTRLVNAYRLELARINQDRTLLADAPQELLARLKQETAKLHEALAAHEIALAAVKLVAEGLVQAMAEEIHRQRGGAGSYGAKGDMAAGKGPSPVALDRTA
jgi:HPt (histidine-containing phosphotransfer) domain-containing protein